jgi:cell volume regulation protein A
MALTLASSVLLGIALIIIIGKAAEFLFKFTYIPDSLLLILVGVIIGPFGINLPISFSTETVTVISYFILLFLLFDGSLELRLKSFFISFTSSIFFTLLNFTVSVGIIGIFLYLLGFSFEHSLLTGFILGGISSSFVIPILKQISVKDETFTRLTFESAITDVFCIVASITMITVMQFGGSGFHEATQLLVTTIAVTVFVSFFAALAWIFLEQILFTEHQKEYMTTIAVLILVASITEYFGGNGPLSALVFGLTLNNSKTITNAIIGFTTTEKKEKRKALKGELGVKVIKPSEQAFYAQISFLLKTFFFVYIGTILDFSNHFHLIIGLTIVILLLLGRKILFSITLRPQTFDQRIVCSMIGRGLAAAALAQLVISKGITGMEPLIGIIYIVLIGSIIISSLQLFFVLFTKGHNKNTKKESTSA